MILELDVNVPSEKVRAMADRYNAYQVDWHGRTVLVTSFAQTDIDGADSGYITKVTQSPSDMQLTSRVWQPENTEVDLGCARIGGDTRNTVMIAGPCSVETEEQTLTTARFLSSLGVRIFRAGAYKSRTSPYKFQGLNQAGLDILKTVRQETGMQIITEVRDATHVDAVIEQTDIIQIGTKAMFDHGILRACGQSRKPVLLKRGFGATLQEFIQMAEYILLGGNTQVVLCERGIRAFEKYTRFTLDLTGVAWLKQHTHLPVVVDPSHAMGYAYGVPDLTRAATAMGVSGLLIEVHPTPHKAWSDASQQLDFDTFTQLYHSLPAVAKAVGHHLC